MLCFDRRVFLLSAAAGALAGCGFRPLYGQGGDANRLAGAVSLQEAETPEDFAYRERLRRRLGLTGGDGGGETRWRLSWALAFDDAGVAITRQDDITRHQVTARAEYLLSPLVSGDPIEGAVKASGGYDATAAAYATHIAQKSEYEQLATELAELTATRLLARFAAASS